MNSSPRQMVYTPAALRGTRIAGPVGKPDQRAELQLLHSRSVLVSESSQALVGSIFRRLVRYATYPPFMSDAPSAAEWAATWVAAVGTGSATLIAAITLLMQRIDARHRFAEQVVIWFDGEVKAQNTAPLPASRISFRATRRAWKYGLIPTRKPVQGGDGQSTLASGQTWTIVRTPASIEQFSEPLQRREIRLELRFTDPAGRRWLRTWPTGELKRCRRSA